MLALFDRDIDMNFRTARRWRHLVALVIVYAVTCQTLLAGPLVVLHIVASASTVVICGEHGSVVDMPGQTDRSDAVCPCGPACAMPGCSSILAFAQTTVATVVWRASLHRTDIVPIRIPALPHRVAVGPQIPRAPPNE